MKPIMGWKINPAHVRRVESALKPQLKWLANRERVSVNLRLRTKFLLSLVLVIAGLTFSTLLIVGHAAEGQVQKAIEQDTRNSVGTFQNVRAERQIELNRDADILATLPSIKSIMADEDPATIQEASEEAWRSSNTELFALTDWRGKIVALHTTVPGFPQNAAQEMVRQALGTGAQGAWWFGHGHLYQVAAHPIEIGSSSQLNLGSVIVGREIDAEVAREVGRIALCEIAFRYGNEPVVSSFSAAMDERMMTTALSHAASSGKLEIDGKQYLVSSVDLTPGNSPTLTLTVLKPADDALAFLTRLDKTLTMLGCFAVLLGATLVFFISRTFTQPLEKLCAGVHALEQGNFTYPLAPDTGDEVSEVTEAFARLRSTLQANEEQKQMLGDQLRQAQKMEAVGRLAGGVAHDFNNLLTVIKGHGDLLELKLGTMSPVQNSIVQMKKAADRATALTRQLLAFSRMQVLQPRVLDLNLLIADLNKMLPMMIGEEIDYKFIPGESLARVKADPSQIEQVLMNLAVNARDAMHNRGKLTIKTQNVVLDAAYAQSHPPTVPGNYVLLVVADTGEGMDEKVKAKIFEPFFSTKELGKGTGLGLSTVYGIVKQSGGYIWVDSTPGQGTRFEIFLPQSAEVVPLPCVEDNPSVAARGFGTVLLAEDEEAVRDLASEFLRSSGYNVIVGKDGLDALELAEQHSAPIDILVTDVVMPRMRGPELAQRLKRAHPAMKIVYMSGYLEHESDELFVSDAEQLQKPFSRESLLQKLRAAAKQEETRSSSRQPLQPA
jgi:signal transduction histidine kinase/ActR/RegA family two-component response regulator